MTGDLIAFWSARLDEDEAAAKAVRPDQDYVDSEHQERWSAARVLREVAAKRALIAEWRDHELERGDTASYTDGLADGLELAARHFAAIDSGHPDYRLEWAP